MSHLVLVHPGHGQPTRPARRHHPSVSLFPTDEERRHIAAALRGLRVRFGTWQRVADEMGVTKQTVQSAVDPKYRTSYAVAVLTARLAKVPVEALLRGTVADAARCPSCGGAR